MDRQGRPIHWIGLDLLSLRAAYDGRGCSRHRRGSRRRRRRHPNSLRRFQWLLFETPSAVAASSSIAASGAADLALLPETALGNGGLFCCLLNRCHEKRIINSYANLIQPCFQNRRWNGKTMTIFSFKHSTGHFRYIAVFQEMDMSGMQFMCP